jgi:RNA polymerase sigma factor (sigma-70 family)
MSTVTPVASPLPAPAKPLSFARLSDEFLARQAGRGSQRAFAALYERYHQPLYRYCRSIVRNDADAQDVLQSTFASALSALQRNQRNAPLRPWLYRIAHNEAIGVLRHRNRENSRELPDAEAQSVASAEDQAADRARWSTLVADFARLPERQRAALLLRELSGLSHEEIAITLGISVGTAKQAIFEARQALAELAEGREMSCDEVRRRLSAGDRRVLRGRRVSAHLRDCHGCEAFAADIRARRAELRAIAPVLPSAVAADLLSRSLRAASVHGGSGAAAAGSAATAGAVGKIAGTALTWKVVTGVAVLAATAAGVTGIRHVLGGTHVNRVSSAPARHVAPAAGTARGNRVTASPSVSQQATGAARPAHQGGAQASGTTSGNAHRSAASAALTHRTGQGTRSHGSGAPAATHRGQGHSPARGQSTTSRGRALGLSRSPATTRSGLGSAKRSGSVGTSAHRKRQTTKTHSAVAVTVTVTTPTRPTPTHIAR